MSRSFDQGFKYVQYAAKKGTMNGAIVLGYYHDNGIGVSKDYISQLHIMTEPWVSDGADESYKFHDWGDRIHRCRAYDVAEKIYNERI